jgi:hypothetical protein
MPAVGTEHTDRALSGGDTISKKKAIDAAMKKLENPGGSSN